MSSGKSVLQTPSAQELWMKPFLVAQASSMLPALSKGARDFPCDRLDNTLDFLPAAFLALRRHIHMWHPQRVCCSKTKIQPDVQDRPTHFWLVYGWVVERPFGANWPVGKAVCNDDQDSRGTANNMCMREGCSVRSSVLARLFRTCGS